MGNAEKIKESNAQKAMSVIRKAYFNARSQGGVKVFRIATEHPGDVGRAEVVIDTETGYAERFKEEMHPHYKVSYEFKGSDVIFTVVSQPKK